ncbi:phage tail tape measure protein, partial [Escherichia coli]|nr:phage tail tape measure protein [Escherichia coli]
MAAAVSLITAPLELVINALRNITDIFGIIIRGWADVIAAFDPARPVESFKKIAQIITGVFGDVWAVIKRSFNSTWNWIAEKLNRLPGISIDLKST